MIARRVLIVDDEPEVVRLCIRVLAQEGLYVRGVESGQEALAILERETFELLVADIKIPDLDGVTLVRRALEVRPGLTAIAITGYATMECVLQALQAGARGVLLKPFGPQDLSQVVAQALEQRDREQERLLLRTQVPILEIAQVLLAEGDIEFLSDRLLEVLAGEVNCEHAALLLLDEERDELHVVGTLGMLSTAAGVRLPAGRVLAEQALNQGRPMPLTEGESLPSPWCELLPVTDPGTILVPLQTLRRAVGLLCLVRPLGQSFTPAERNLLTIVGGQIAVTLENARLYETIARGKREWEATFDTIAEGIVMLDPSFRIIRINRPLAARLGKTPQELVGRYCYGVFGCGSVAVGDCMCARVMASGQLERRERQEPALGGVFQTSAYPVHDSRGQVWAIVQVYHDVTQSRQMEVELIRNEKLAAMGRLAASLAHEVNNPLQALRSGFRLLLNRQVSPDKRRQYLEIADREVERLIAIVERMLGFYRVSSEQPCPLDINAIVDGTLALVGREWESSRVTVQRCLATDLPPVPGVADQLQQVFLNLVLNARQSMPDGGTLTVRTDWDPQRHRVEILFQDTGVGIPADEISRLFEPFYTTRPGGSGLGLAISYGIVERHGGRIEVQSEVGVGSTFTVSLPVSRGD